ncbi:MAG: FAD:protein FMN transferase, partial [Gammaproteobacteria bacterium]|nr:FAD:protein FMN transferase [Gammaproteobacteria bacterium]
MNTSWTRRQLLRAAGALVLVPLLPMSARSALSELTGRTMGTRYRVHIRNSTNGLYLPKLKQSIERELETTDRLLSTYRAGSELVRFNTAGTRWYAASPTTLRVLETALSVQYASGGAFNAAAAPLVDYWGFGPQPGYYARNWTQVPHAVLSRVADAEIQIKPGYIRKHDRLAALDLNAIAKGDALDRVATVLNSAGIVDYLVGIGGEIVAKGTGPDGSGWRIGIEDPNGGIRRTIRLDGQAVATSGDYVNYFVRDGKRYSHILDPRSGRPVEHDLTLV